jgi:hypothetical protein
VFGLPPQSHPWWAMRIVEDSPNRFVARGGKSPLLSLGLSLIAVGLFLGFVSSVCPPKAASCSDFPIWWGILVAIAFTTIGVAVVVIPSPLSPRVISVDREEHQVSLKKRGSAERFATTSVESVHLASGPTRSARLFDTRTDLELRLRNAETRKVAVELSNGSNTKLTAIGQSLAKAIGVPFVTD